MPMDYLFIKILATCDQIYSPESIVIQNWEPKRILNDAR